MKRRFLVSGLLGISSLVALGFVAYQAPSFQTEAIASPALADDDECVTAYKAVMDAAPKKDTWAEPILDHLHDELYRFNDEMTADVEMIFCRLTKVMGIDPNLATLPDTITKTDPNGGTLVVTISAPTETFATTNGYTAKAELTYNGSKFLDVWWTGSAASSKGYVIQGDNPMKKDGNTRLRYAQWDQWSWYDRQYLCAVCWEHCRLYDDP